MLSTVPFAHIWQRLSERLHDFRLGVHTRGFRSAAAYAPSREYQSYEPLEYESIYRALNKVPFLAGPQVLLDYGAGMGRVLAAATRYPFQRLIGIELSPELCELARLNVARALATPGLPPIAVVQGDARSFEVPDDVTVFFLYNPFVGDVLEAVVHRIEESFARAPRNAMVLYVRFPHDTNAFDTSPKMRRTATLPVFARPEMEFLIYQAIGT